MNNYVSLGYTFESILDFFTFVCTPTCQFSMKMLFMIGKF